jgi:4'-phosphopantetheinyl transferase EntD
MSETGEAKTASEGAIDLGRAFPAAVVVEQGRVGAVDGALTPEEETAVARAVPKRREEFRTGRLLARRALARLGRPAPSLPMGAARGPVWPAGVIGSIAHAGGRCVVAVATTDQVRALGLDFEPYPNATWDPSLADSVLADEERAAAARADAADRADLAGVPTALVTFCAKESIYKALQPIVGTGFGFQDVALRFDEGARSFRGRLAAAASATLAPLGPLLARLEGRFQTHGGVVLASCWLPA